jgi:sarcosine oxidase subunit alpha
MKSSAHDNVFRLATGGLVDRQRAVPFTFDGKTYRGLGGDTLASALLANGVRLMGRSFKYHRPRGILSAGSEEPNALVEIGNGARRTPNTPATMVELHDGLTAKSQNRWPSLNLDLLAVNSLLSPIFAAGFYYKTFMWPASFWEKVYEPIIRRAAGLGHPPAGADPDAYEKSTAHCDVLVIGAGPAGLMAALAAARAGARVILCDEDFRLGGRCLAETQTIAGEPSHVWAQTVEDELAALPDIRVLRRTTVFGVYDGGTYAAIERVSDHTLLPLAHNPRQRLWRIIAKRAILASGAIERPLVFGNNDRPGVMLAGSVRTYVNRFAACPGRRAVVFANNADAFRTVADLQAAGLQVVAVVDPRQGETGTGDFAPHVRILRGVVTRVHGGKQVHGVTCEEAEGKTTDLECDLLAVSGGWNPALHLSCHLGAAPVWDDRRAIFLPGALPRGMLVAGAAGGNFSLAEALSTGLASGHRAVVDCGLRPTSLAVPTAASEATEVSPLWHVLRAKGKAFVDFQNDVTVDDVALAEREAFRSVEHLKRYTTLGMATDQGKTSNVNALAIMAHLTGKTIGATGTTRFRPPYTGVPIGALAGHHRGKEFRPTRLPPSHAWAAEQSATFVESGYWLRAQYFPQPGESTWLETVSREVRQTRTGVGICDVSTLGKIDIQGRDAALFLDRLYMNTFSTLSIGKARYGVMLREDGIAMDDGTTSRLAEDHFFMTTTTANAGRVMEHMEFCHQVLWPEMDVQMISVSEQWAQYSVAGPRARDLLRRLVDSGQDISDNALPYMGIAELTILGGIRARLFRISFSGELAYELSVPARFGDAVIRQLMLKGADIGAIPYGTEALGVMRIEKGHVAGNEINGQTTATDLGLGRMMSKKKDYIGRVMAGRPGLTDPDRPRFIGFKPVDRSARLFAGAHFLARGQEPIAANDQGYMTSVAFSPSLGHWIGLGFLIRAADRIGETVRAQDPLRNLETPVEVCHPAFYDAEGVRLRG